MKGKAKLLLGLVACSVAAGAAGLHAHPASAPASLQSVTPIIQASASPAPQTQMSLHPDVPARLRIPKLGVNAPVVNVGRTPTGEMQAPAGRLTAGWYKSGYLPGSIGNAVLAGHSNHIEGRGVFYALAQLEPGDEVLVETKTHALTFHVAAAQTYAADAGQLPEVFGKSDKARLNLITCTGVWRADIKNYSERLVVFTEFMGEKPL